MSARNAGTAGVVFTSLALNSGRTMKRGIFLATLMMTAAGVASANLLTTAPRDAAPRDVASPLPPAQPATAAPPAAAKSGNDKPGIGKLIAQPAPATHAAPKVAVSQTTQKNLVEPQQAPVPFRMKPRPPANLPPVADKATEAKAADKPAETPSDPAADTAGQSAARAAIEADGYKSVKVLRKGANGVWHASALRGKTTVMLTVDAGGNVSSD
jgi:hypothetical protein